MTPVGAADVFLTEGRQHGTGEYVAEEVGENYRESVETKFTLIAASRDLATGINEQWSIRPAQLVQDGFSRATGQRRPR